MGLSDANLVFPSIFGEIQIEKRRSPADGLPDGLGVLSFETRCETGTALFLQVPFAQPEET
jgi:hypothetical protein